MESRPDIEVRVNENPWTVLTTDHSQLYDRVQIPLEMLQLRLPGYVSGLHDTSDLRYRRHSKCRLVLYLAHTVAIDIEKEACWKCAGRLEPLFETKASTPFQSE